MKLPEYDIIYQSNDLRAVLYPGADNPRQLFCEFDYLDNARDGFPDIRPKPSMVNRGFSVLRIDTSSNNWFLSGDIPAFKSMLNSLSQNYECCSSIAFSMGVAAALMFSNDLKLDRIMAFSPVVSIFEDDIRDRRFKSFRKYVENPEFRHMWKDGNRGLKGGVCYDPFVPVDVDQARLIQHYYNGMRPVALPFGGHPCTRVIKEVKGFQSIQNLVVQGCFESADIRQLHRDCRRDSAIYKNNLCKKQSI